MTKLIVEMEKPTRCGECKCRHVEFDIDYVAVFCAIKDNEYVEDPDSIPSWCPICGVLPKEHGDLADRDALWELMRTYDDYQGAKEAHDLELIHRDSILFAIETAPTVIAAEREKE